MINLLDSFNKLKLEILVILFVLILSYFREPLFFLEPRIWAEEGSTHFQSIFQYGLFGSLFKPHIGYFSFFNNYVSSLGLGIFGLDRVAYVTTYVSFLFIISVVITPFILPSKYWDSRVNKF